MSTLNILKITDIQSTCDIVEVWNT